MLDPIDLAVSLVQTPGLSGHEERVAQVVEHAMGQLGYWGITRDDYGSVIGLTGPRTGRPRLLFDGHMDVVPAAGDWTVDPYGGLVRDGRLWGRGSADMKGGLAAALCGIAAAAAEGLARPVAISATVLEETIEGVALARVLDRLDPEHVVICEPSDLEICVGQRGRMEIIMSVRGAPAHSSRPGVGSNPITLAARGIQALAAMALPADGDLGPAVLAATDMISEPYPSISLTPSAVRVRYDRRTLVGEEPAGAMATMARCVRSVDPQAFSFDISERDVTAYTGAKIVSQLVFSAWRIAEDHPLVGTARKALQLVGLEPILGVFPACTNGSESAGVRGIPTFILGPGRLDACHAADESVSVEQVRLAAQVYKELALRMAND
jgi:putative selenium metabolism hydrolase